MNIKNIMKNDDQNNMPMDDNINNLWAVASITGVSRKIGELSATLTKIESIHFLNQIEAKLDDIILSVENGIINTVEIASLSLWTKLVQQYEETGAICYLKEVSERMNMHDYTYAEDLAS